MSASILREAAALMRERASDMDLAHGDAATKFDGLGWSGHRNAMSYLVLAGDQIVHESATEEGAEFAASWHPAVALAVADWLDAEAAAVESLAQAGIDRQFDEAWVARETANRHGHAFTVARTYLGREA